MADSEEEDIDGDLKCGALEMRRKKPYAPHFRSPPIKSSSPLACDFNRKRSFKRNPDGTNSMSAHHSFNPGAILDEPTWRCHQNPFVGALRIQEPVILGEPQIKG